MGKKSVFLLKKQNFNIKKVEIQLSQVEIPLFKKKYGHFLGISTFHKIQKYSMDRFFGTPQKAADFVTFNFKFFKRSFEIILVLLSNNIWFWKMLKLNAFIFVKFNGPL